MGQETSSSFIKQNLKGQIDYKKKRLSESKNPFELNTNYINEKIQALKEHKRDFIGLNDDKD